jgi:tetratricopeptide (TPR) repeat protein
MVNIPERMAQAGEHRRAGRLAQAERIYRGILAEAPQHPHALHQLGTLVYQMGRYEEALGLIAQALVAQGPHPLLYANLATVCLALDRLDEAQRNARFALQFQPNQASAHYCLGMVLYRRERLGEAESAFRAARRSDPVHGDARRRLEGSPTEQRFAIIAQMRDLLETEPNNAEARYALGHALLGNGHPAAAIDELQESLRLKPQSAPTHAALGLAHQQLDEMAEAIDCFRAALRLTPSDLQTRYDLGTALETMGHNDESAAVFDAILAEHPGDTQAMAALSKLAVAGHYRFADAAMTRMKELAARNDLPLPEACRVHFALAQLLDRAGDYDAAFAHARRANAARLAFDRRHGYVFDPEEHHLLIDRLVETFTPEYFTCVRTLGSESDMPIFVVGMMRTGTSLVEQILASHPQVHGAGELRDIGTLATGLQHRVKTSDPYPECCRRLDAPTIQTMAQLYLERLQRRGRASSDAPVRAVDKCPLNFLHLGFIATLFPRARIVHCWRDPLDTCVSCFLQDFHDPFPFKHDLAHLGACYREYERLMAYWRSALPLPMLEVQYEELTADAEPLSRRLVEFCGLDWDDRCLRFHEVDRPVRTASMFQVRQPMYRSAVGRWKRYEAHLGSLIAALSSARSAGGMESPDESHKTATSGSEARIQGDRGDG